MINGHSPRVPNGSSPIHTNGSGTGHLPVQSPLYRGHDREEVTRILIQGLADMGYHNAAMTLSSESGFELESPSVAEFRSAILAGDWSEAEAILLGSASRNNADYTIENGPDGDQGLILAEGANKLQMLFEIRQQKFLELLDRRDLTLALMVLRQELTPLNHDIHQLHVLSSLLMCPPEDLRSQARWPETIDESRRALLRELTKGIAPSVMIRDHRLAELFDQVKQAQINNCLYHNTSIPPSLYSDHQCNREDFPLHPWIQLEDHLDEIWHVKFSHDGSKLATASQDKSVIVYDTNTFNQIHKLDRHGGGVTYVAWSPDDTKLITCSMDTKARVWDVTTGSLDVTVEHRTNNSNYAITAAAWLPNSASFVTTSHDIENPVCYWARSCDTPKHSWGRTGFRAEDCAITPDGRRLLIMDRDSGIYVFDLETFRQEYSIDYKSKLTGLALSRDGESAIVNLAKGEVHLLDVKTGTLLRKFIGQKQGKFVIRSDFGGAGDSFVLSGSEGIVFLNIVLRVLMSV